METQANPFAELLGDAYPLLPQAVRTLHECALPAHFQGEVEIAAPQGWPARLLAAITGLPRRSGIFPLRFEILADAHEQQWIRYFPPRPMRSCLRAANGLLHERLGPAHFRFRLEGDGEGVRWHLVQVRALGVPLPLRWFSGMRAREHARDDRYAFDVDVTLPLLGHVVTYRGWLDVA